MRQDRRHPMRFTNRHTLRDALTHRARTRSGRDHGMPPLDAGRSRRRWPRPPRATVPPRGAPLTGQPQCGVRRRVLARGATLLDVMFAVLALTAGAQGFARWQAAGGMSSAELASTPSVTMMALPARGAAQSRAPAAGDAWLVLDQP
ncbi:hypothetical protein [Pandoraea soli]